MSTSSKYICQNRHGTYYARLIIPLSLRTHFNNKREIRRSLQTDSKRLAIKRARLYRVEFENIIDKLMGKRDNTTDRAKKIVDALFAPKKVADDFGEPTGRNNETVIDSDCDIIEYITFIDLKGNTTTIDYDGDVDKETQAYYQLVNGSPKKTKPQTGKKISELIADYCTYKKNPAIKKAWKSEDTIRQKESILNAFVNTIGDKPLTDFSISDAKRYVEIAFIIPPNFNNKDHVNKFKGLTIEQLLDENIDTSEFKPRKTGGIVNDLKIIQAFLQWVSDEPDIDGSIEKPLKVFKRAVNSIDYKATRRGFTLDELKILFEKDNPSSENYVKGFKSKRAIDKNLKYWMPLISLYSGATIAEICQLHLDDIIEKQSLDGNSLHWVFDIYACDEKDTRVKNEEHRPRSIPIHNKLIELGLIDYIDELKANNEKKLFPTSTRKAGGYGAESQWWAEYSDNAGLTDPDITFHSFRHTLNTQLSDRHTPEAYQTAISGHAFKSMSKTTYSNGKRGFDIRPLVDVINSIDYGINHPLFQLEMK